MLTYYILSTGSEITLAVFDDLFQLNDKFLVRIGMLFVGLEYHLESVS